MGHFDAGGGAKFGCSSDAPLPGVLLGILVEP